MKTHIRLTRREAIANLGVGAAATILPAIISAAKSPAFPKGAVIRTILKDLPPSALAGKATLFHEHLSIDLPYFGPPLSTPPPPPATADVTHVIGEVRIAGQEGVGCIVDGGHLDMGRRSRSFKADC